MKKKVGHKAHFFFETLIYVMNFILQTINKKITLDICFQMERAKEYWDWKNSDDSFEITYGHIDNFWFDELTDLVKIGRFKPEEWCPVGTIEFVEKYLRIFFGDEIADKAMKPLNIPDCFLNNSRFDCGRYVWNKNLKEDFDDTDDKQYFIKDNIKIKNPNNGIMSLVEAYNKGLEDVQVSTLIKKNVSEWRAFIHNGKVVDIKNYSGDPFVFPDMDTILNSYIPRLDFKEGTLDVYIDGFEEETYILECHRFFSCGLYGFNHSDILPLMFWRTFKEIIK